MVDLRHAETEALRRDEKGDILDFTDDFIDRSNCVHTRQKLPESNSSVKSCARCTLLWRVTITGRR